MRARSDAYQAGAGHRSWKGTAFIVEALVLLVFVAASLAIMLSLFAHAYATGTKSQMEARAILVATNTAETFAASPEAGTFVAIDEPFVSCCVVREQSTEVGTLYYADVFVYDLQKETLRTGRSADELTSEDLEPLHALYSLETARYVSKGVA